MNKVIKWNKIESHKRKAIYENLKETISSILIFNFINYCYAKKPQTIDKLAEWQREK